VSGPIPAENKLAEAGFTLVELIIYISLSVLILSLVGGFLLNGVRAERDVVSTAQAANTAQLIAESIKRDVRNATEVRVNDDNNLLTVRTIGMGATLDSSCRAWYFNVGTTDATAAIYTIDTGDTPIGMTVPTDLKLWSIQGQGIIQINPADSPGFIDVFAFSDPSVALSFAVGGETPVVVSTSVTPRAIPDNEGTCFAD
jgi:type II secretory pathway pseudopilin PulG